MTITPFDELLFKLLGHLYAPETKALTSETALV